MNHLRTNDPNNRNFGHRARSAALGLAVAFGLLIGALPNAGAADAKPAGVGTSVTLLGTAGGPGAMAERAGIATLISVGDRHYLIDAGEGVARQLARIGIAEPAIKTVFLTHLHDDHTAGLPALMTFAHTRRGTGMEIIGPPATRRFVESATSMLSVSAQLRMKQNTRLLPPEKVFSAREVEPGLVYSDDRVRVTAFENNHYDFAPGSPASAQRSYAYRFQTPDRVIVLTGDTGNAPGLAEFAQGADILVSEMVSAEDVASVPAFAREHMIKEHLSPTQVGQLAARAKVNTVVVSHIRKVSEADASEEIRRHFSGKIVIGTDLARF